MGLQCLASEVLARRNPQKHETKNDCGADSPTPLTVDQIGWYTVLRVVATVHDDSTTKSSENCVFGYGLGRPFTEKIRHAPTKFIFFA